MEKLVSQVLKNRKVCFSLCCHGYLDALSSFKYSPAQNCRSNFSILDTPHYFVTLFWKGILWKLRVSAQEQNCCEFVIQGLIKPWLLDLDFRAKEFLDFTPSPLIQSFTETRLGHVHYAVNPSCNLAKLKFTQKTHEKNRVEFVANQ